MIFVTLGTHEQPFDRLIRKVDQLAEKKSIGDEVFIQIGPNYNYIPRFCHYKELLSFQEMDSRLKEARIIIAHGGLGSIFQSLINNKVPIIVPRQKKYSEHVDDHQLLFSKKISLRKEIIIIYDVDDLEDALVNYEKKLRELDISDTIASDIRKNFMDFSININEKYIKIFENKNGKNKKKS